MKRDVQGALLIIVGVTVLRLSLGDAYLRYVKEGLRPFLIVAGIVVVALGVAAALGKAEPSLSEAHEDHATVDGHHHQGGPRIAWLLLLPVLAVFVVAPPALGAFAAARDSGTVAQPTGDAGFEPLPAGSVVPMLLTDYAERAVWDDTRSLADRTVALTGFATRREGGGWYLTRMSLSCCAADAVATKIEVRGGGEVPAENSWVRLTGTWSPSEGEREEAVPVIVASRVEPVAEPQHPYE